MQSPPRPSDSSNSGLTVYLYDAEGHDRQVELSPRLIEADPATSLFWIDVVGRTRTAICEAGEILQLRADSIADLLQSTPQLRIDNYGDYVQFSLNVASPGAARPGADEADEDEEGLRWKAEPSRLDFVIGERWLLTVHDEDLEFLRGFRAQDKAETEIGALSPQALAASLLDWHLDTFFEEVARIELAVDRLDERVLREPSNVSLLGRMLAVRRRISRLRRLLSVQRPIFYGLSRPDLTKLVESEAADHFRLLTSRFERAVDEVEHTRDLILGSFEIFTSRTNQETNDLVKVLTFFTVIIGSVAAIAGLFGMNFDPPFFRTGSVGFFAVSTSLVTLAAGAWAWAKHKNWI